MSEDNGTPGAMGGSCGAVPRAPGPVNATGRGNQTERADVGRLLPVAAVDGGASLGTSLGARGRADSGRRVCHG